MPTVNGGRGPQKRRGRGVSTKPKLLTVQDLDQRTRQCSWPTSTGTT